MKKESDKLRELNFYIKQRATKSEIARYMGITKQAVAYYFRRYKLERPKIRIYTKTSV